VDGESADCSSAYLSSNSDQENDSLVKRPSIRFGGNVDSLSDEQIDVDKLDQGERELFARIMELQKHLPVKYHKRFDQAKSPDKTGTVAFEHEESPDRKPITTTSIQISGPGNKFIQANAHGLMLGNIS